MIGPVLMGEDLIAWNDATAKSWKALIVSNPGLLDVPCDVYKVKTAGELMRHIVAVELRYAQRLHGLTQTPYEELKYGSAEEIFAVHDEALTMIRSLFADPSYDWDAEFEFPTISLGNLKASRKTVLFHALLHGIRHYAQLATLARQHGFAPGFQMDYLVMGAKPA